MASDPYSDALRQGLEDVINPVGYLSRRAKEIGGRLNSQAYSIANDLGFVQKLAKDALKAADAKRSKQEKE